MNKAYLFNRLRHLIFGEKFYKKLNFEWDKNFNRIQIIQKIIDTRKFNSYLEIGCYNDDCFSKINASKKVGVDPFLGGNVRMTSDDFFNINKEKFDCIFIDGLHIYEQVKKDIINSLKFLNDNGVVFLHDCMPTRFIHQATPRATNVWNGDVWKNIVESRTKSEIDTYVVYADHGVGMILKRPNKKILKLSINNFKKLKFRDYFYNYKEYLNIVYKEDLKNIF